MRVLVVHNNYRHSGGEEAVVSAEVDMLRQNGHMVKTWLKDSNAIDGAVGKLRTAWNLPFSATAKHEMTAQLKQFTPDVVHVHNIFPLLTSSIYDACHEANVPVVQTLHNYRTVCAAATLMRSAQPCDICIYQGPYSGTIHTCYHNSRIGSLALSRMISKNAKRGVWQRIDRFIALTEFARAKFIAAGFPAARITVKQNFTSSAVVPDEEEKGERVGALFVGRLSEEKGIRLMLDAWDGLAVPLHIVGDGPLRGEVERRRTSWIQIAGSLPHNEVKQLMRRAAFLIFPSLWYEGMPMTIIEAFQASLPVIASRLGAMTEMIEDGKTGLHFTAGDASDLQAKVQWAMQNAAALRCFGQQASHVFSTKYTAERNYLALQAIYRAVIHESQAQRVSASI